MKGGSLASEERKALYLSREQMRLNSAIQALVMGLGKFKVLRKKKEENFSFLPLRIPFSKDPRFLELFHSSYSYFGNTEPIPVSGSLDVRALFELVSKSKTDAVFDAFILASPMLTSGSLY